MRLFILILLAFLANQSAAQGLIDPELANKVHQCAQKKIDSIPSKTRRIWRSHSRYLAAPNDDSRLCAIYFNTCGPVAELTSGPCDTIRDNVKVPISDGELVEGKFWRSDGNHNSWPLCGRFEFESLLTRLYAGPVEPPKQHGSSDWFIGGYEAGEKTWHAIQKLVPDPHPQRDERLIQCQIYTHAPNKIGGGGSNVYGHCLGYVVGIANAYDWNVAYQSCAEEINLEDGN